MVVRSSGLVIVTKDMLCSVNGADPTINQTVNNEISKGARQARCKATIERRRYLTHFDDGNLHNIVEVF